MNTTTTDPQVYVMQANNAEDMEILNDPEQRSRFVKIAVKQAQDAGYHVLSILDVDGNQVHVEAFGPTEQELAAMEAEYDAARQAAP